MNTASIVIPLTFINIFAVLSIPSVTRFTDALVRFGSILADGINVAVVGPINTFVNILTSFSHGVARIEEKGDHTKSNNLQGPHCSLAVCRRMGAQEGIL